MFCALAQGQRFEAADVHPSAPIQSTLRKTTGADTTPTRTALPGGRFELRNASILDLIQMGWNVSPETVFGGPSWIDLDRFDIIAKAPPSATPADRALMLRALLADRFGLVLHNDTRPVPVFALSVGKRGAQIKRAESDEPGGCRTSAERGPPPTLVAACRNVTMAAFAAQLQAMGADYLDQLAVIDSTGLKGGWDLTVKWTYRLAWLKGADGERGSSIFEALDKQLGLVLESVQRPMPVVVVDRVNRTPAENPVGTIAALPPVPTEFEVAEVKPSKPESTQPQGGFMRGGRVDLRNRTLRSLIALAWDFDEDRIKGGPKWLDTDYFDIVAKAPDTGLLPLVDDMLAMLRKALTDTFKLSIRHEDQPLPVYALLSGKHGSKLKEADPSSRSGCKISYGALSTGEAAVTVTTYTCRNTTLAALGDRLRSLAPAYLDHPVVDLTGLNGSWDFALSWSPKSQVGGRADDPNGSLTVFEAVDRQMGLRLEGGQKHPVPVIVVEHAEEPAADR
jgi:uncharacterized protein (TIGR03435 family)